MAGPEIVRRNFRQYDKDDGQAGIIAPTQNGNETLNLTMVASTAWFSRFTVSRPMTITLISFGVSTAAGSDDACDVGIYTPSGADLTRVVSAGATIGKLNATGIKTVTIAATTLLPGQVYYAGFSCGTITTTAAVLGGATFGASNYNAMFGTSVPQLIFATKATSHPLPASVTAPTTVATSMRLGIRES